VRPWFWGWLVTCVALAIASALARDRASAPFAVGAAAAAALEAFRATPTAEWTAFLVVSSAVFILVNRRRYRARHAPGATDEPAPGPDEDVPRARYRPRHSRGRTHAQEE
jgi:membrane protein implicated in regulation of membrane protease activity